MIQVFKRGSKWNTRFCSLSNISKEQLGASAQTWQQYSKQGLMEDFQS